jgi:hypothetical protein
MLTDKCIWNTEEWNDTETDKAHEPANSYINKNSTTFNINQQYM